MRSHPQQQIVNDLFTRKKVVNMIFKFLNISGNVFFLRWRKRYKPANIKKLLLVHFGGFGDALLLTSAIGYMKEQMPQCEIDLMTNEDVHYILQNDTRFSSFHIMDNRFGVKYLRDILKSTRDFKLTRKKYDAAICLRSFMDNGVLPLYLSGIANYIVGFSTGGFSFALDEVVPWVNGIHETEHYRDALKSFCPDITLSRPKIMYDKASAQLVVRKIIGETPFLVVHFGSREKERTINAERSLEILTWLLDNTHYNIVLTGTQREAYLWERLNMSNQRILTTFGAFDIFAFIECIAQSAGVITVETFAAHVGAMCEVPVVSFWSGVTDYRQWQPLGNDVHVMRHPVPCTPCFKPCDGMECMHHNVLHDMSAVFGVLSPGSESTLSPTPPIIS